jgi:nitrite reductase/ring-hydroxylating ferredoxin subunit
MSRDINQHDACGACPAAAANRRAFLRDAALAVAGALALGANASVAFAERVTAVTASLSHGVLRSYALPREGTVSVDVDNDVILSRWEHRIYAFSLRCPHRGTRLEWIANDRNIFCPKHKARFLANGTHTSGRQTRDLDRYDIRREGEAVVVDVSAVRRADQDAARWRLAVVDAG